MFYFETLNFFRNLNPSTICLLLVYNLGITLEYTQWTVQIKICLTTSTKREAYQFIYKKSNSAFHTKASSFTAPTNFSITEFMSCPLYQLSSSYIHVTSFSPEQPYSQ